ncbi:THUMP-like domain-containing protein [Roseivirga misakiensis]|uniref:Uncharacterized protein n=1 Tax=Roseivirga misakiensis TaxID=1563681 RepID=A0A1E5T655_9BACT|nr:class I SAM-dependent methyltransferase [Roseivirga misakiensis]OEK06840.1 hypothetical protein BFP71_04055 [Roseivirga misakiensis]
MIQALSNPEIQQFIQDHLNDDPAALMLQAGKYSGWPMKEIVSQIQSKRKARKKLPTWFDATGIVYPPLISMEQCSSEQTASYKADLVKEGSTMADLTGGFGVDFFAFAKNFKTCHYVERNADLTEIAQHNFNALGLNNVQVHHTQSAEFLDLPIDFDLLYLDPARRGDRNQKVVALNDCEPNVIHLLPTLMSKSKQVMIKTSPLLDIKGAIRDLDHVAQVHVVSLNNEVKELVFILERGFSDHAQVNCINLVGDGISCFDFSYQDEEDLVIDFGGVNTYLYEPNASILKAGAFKSIANAYGLTKLHPNSHLYTSNMLVDNFPGRSFEVIESVSLNKKALKKILPASKANITVRNYPMTVAQIRKKTDLKEGGEEYLFATSDMDGSKVFRTRKVID